jgi:Kef-type K+ transport system membrane component KefB
MVIPLLLSLAILLALAKTGGVLAVRIGQPAVLGELMAGLVLGPSVLNLFGQPYFSAVQSSHILESFGEIGVIFLMFSAGLEIDFSSFIKLGKPAFLVGSLGVVFPIVCGALVSLFSGLPLAESVFIGIVMGATSVSISAQTLMELGQIRSREGLTLLAAAVVDDILAIIALSVFSAVELGADGGWLNLVLTIFRMIAFLVGAFVVGVWLLPRVSRWVGRLPISEGRLSFVLVSILIFAWASDAVGGITAITGAFIAGLALSRSSNQEEIKHGLSSLTYAFFVPVFLAGIGLSANVRLLSGDQIVFATAICLVAVASKVIGAGAGARLAGYSWQETLRVGVGMTSRGEVGLIIAGIGLMTGIFGQSSFTAMVIMILVTTLITPSLLRLLYPRKESVHA